MARVWSAPWRLLVSVPGDQFSSEAAVLGMHNHTFTLLFWALAEGKTNGPHVQKEPSLKTIWLNCLYSKKVFWWKSFYHPYETSCDLRLRLFYSYHFYSKRDLNCNISLCIKVPAVKRGKVLSTWFIGLIWSNIELFGTNITHRSR